jgi:hypothetical protein
VGEHGFGLEAMRVVGDADHVDLASEAVGLADLSREEPPRRGAQSTTSTITDWPSR